jgi:hypothetical protein
MLSIHRRAALAAGLTASTLAVMGGVASAAGDPFSGYLLHSGEQTGYKVAKPPAVAPTVAAYVKLSGLTGAAAKAETSLLTRAGFVGGAQEPLSDSGGRAGFSLVGTFVKPGGPKLVRDSFYSSALTSQKAEKLTKVTTFRIPGVASARGVTAITTAKRGLIATANIYWTEGACALGSGLLLPGADGLSTKAIDAPAIAGVKAQVKRTKGKCVAPPAAQAVR